MWVSPRRTAMMPPMDPTWVELMQRDGSARWSKSAASSSRGSWLPMDTRVFSSSWAGRSSRTATRLPAS